MQQALPAGWIVQTDPNSGAPFYVNTATGESSWTPPVSQQPYGYNAYGQQPAYAQPTVPSYEPSPAAYPQPSYEPQPQSQPVYAPPSPAYEPQPASQPAYEPSPQPTPDPTPRSIYPQVEPQPATHSQAQAYPDYSKPSPEPAPEPVGVLASATQFVAEHVVGVSFVAEATKETSESNNNNNNNGGTQMQSMGSTGGDGGDGGEIQYTRRGIPVRRTDLEREKEATHEHDRDTNQLSLLCSATQVQETYGLGIRLYFDFCKYMILVNLVLFLVSLINFIPHAQSVTNIFSSSKHFEVENYFDVMLLSSYQGGCCGASAGPGYTNLKTSTIITIILTFLFGVVYSLHLRRVFKQAEEVDRDNHFSASEGDTIKANERVSSVSRAVRHVVSFVIYVAMLGVAVVITYFLVKEKGTITTAARNASANASSSTITGSLTTRVSDFFATSGIAYALSITLVISNMVMQRLCVVLTNFEKHRTWTNFRRQNTLKFIVFKLLNVTVFYLVQWIATRIDAVICQAHEFGFQFFTLLVIEITLNNFIELFLPLIKRRLFKGRAQSGEHGDEHYRPEFDLAEEYLELIYRQYIVYIGYTTFPIIAGMATIANFIEVWLDKYRLLRVCQKPPRTTGSMRSLIVFFLFIIALLGLLTYPSGAVWSLVGSPNFNPCCDFQEIRSNTTATCLSVGL